MKKLSTTSELNSLRNSLIRIRNQNKPVITICGETSCQASGCSKIIKAIRHEMKKQNLENKVDIRVTGCHGFCEKGPIVVIYPSKIFYPNVKSDDVSRIISETVVKNNILDDLLYIDPETNKKIILEYCLEVMD